MRFTLRNGIFSHKMRSTWQSIFDKEIVRPIGLGLSYVSAMKETMEIEFQDKRIRVAQREAEGEENIGLVVWDAGLCLLETLPHLSIFHRKNLRILELGSGTGIVGIATKLYCPRLEVVLSDLESNLDLIKKNAQTNGLSVSSDENDASVSVVSIPWGNKESSLKYGVFDVVLCSDTVYETEALPLFLRTLLWVTQKDSIVYIAYRRRVDEREIPFFKKLEHNFEISVLDPCCSSSSSTSTTKRNHWHNMQILQCRRR